MRYIIEAHAIMTATIQIKIAKPPSAHFATNQKRDAKQIFGARMKNVTRPVASSAILTIVRQIGTVHLPLGGNGFDLSARNAVSMVKATCT